MTRSRSKKLFICLAGAGLVIGAAIFIWLPPLGPGTKPGISVLRLTNDPANGRSVLFSLTNPTAARMTYILHPPEIKSGSAWLPPLQPGHAFNLPPHESTNFIVAIPSGTNVWRVPVFYGYLPSGMNGVRRMVRYNLRINWIRFRYHRSPVMINNSDFDLYETYSPQMSNQPAAAAGFNH